jgi:hypothetical protein
VNTTVNNSFDVLQGSAFKVRNGNTLTVQGSVVK